MSGIEDFRAICRTLCFYADRLALLRGAHADEEAKELTRGYLSASNTSMAYRVISPWYRIVEPLYAELEALMQETEPENARFVLSDPEIQSQLARLHRLRAVYEFDKEVEKAKALLNSDNPSASLNEIIAHQAYWALPQEAKEVLDGARRVAIVGSGPLPLTALSVVSNLPCSVVCFERNAMAYQLGGDIIALSAHRDRIESLNADIEHHEGLETFDALFAAVLTGVNLDNESHSSKNQLILSLTKALPDGAPVMLRDPYHLGGLFYPPAGFDDDFAGSSPAGFLMERYDPEIGPGAPYRSSFLIISRINSE